MASAIPRRMHISIPKCKPNYLIFETPGDLRRRLDHNESLADASTDSCNPRLSKGLSHGRLVSVGADAKLKGYVKIPIVLDFKEGPQVVM